MIFNTPTYLGTYLSDVAYKPSLLTQDAVLTSIQRHLNVMDVRWTSKQRCVLILACHHYNLPDPPSLVGILSYCTNWLFF